MKKHGDGHLPRGVNEEKTVIVTVANIHGALSKQFPWRIPLKSQEKAVR